MKSYKNKIKYIKIGHYLFYDAVYNNSGEDLVNYLFYSFAVNCYHLKDWLQRNSVFTEQEIQNHINNNVRLKNIGAIAHESKHFQLTTKHWKDIKIIKTLSQFSFNNPRPVFQIIDNQQNKSSDITINMAHKSLYSWDKLFKAKGLPQPFEEYH